MKEKEEVITIITQIQQLLDGMISSKVNKKITFLFDDIVKQTAILTKEKDKYKALCKIYLPKKSERIKEDKDLAKNSDTSNSSSTETTKKAIRKGNNGAKRKVHENLEEEEEEIIDVYPDDDAIKEFGLKPFSYVDQIRYVCIPSKFIKRIYRCYKYVFKNRIFMGKAPGSPVLNSLYDSSVYADIIKLRYVFGLPVERIGKLYNENGLDISKGTLHKFFKNIYRTLEVLIPVHKRAILESPYIHFDETYHRILDLEKGSRKGYFWAALSDKSKLIHFFYDHGSRAKKVFTDYLPRDYRGAIQSDGYSVYKQIEEWTYSKAEKLGCMQHCKRKFLDIEENDEAMEIAKLYNEFYQIRKNYSKCKWIKKSIVIYKILKNKLRSIEKRKNFVKESKLNKAVKYAINQLGSIQNIIVSTEYELDNNNIERPMRYVSISRHNSLFFGSNKGAERSAFISDQL